MKCTKQNWSVQSLDEYLWLKKWYTVCTSGKQPSPWSPALLPPPHPPPTHTHCPPPTHPSNKTAVTGTPPLLQVWLCWQWTTMERRKHWSKWASVVEGWSHTHSLKEKNHKGFGSLSNSTPNHDWSTLPYASIPQTHAFSSHLKSLEGTHHYMQLLILLLEEEYI